MEESMGFKKLHHDCHCLADKVKNCWTKERCQDSIGPLSKKGKAGRVRICKVTGDRRLCARMASMGVYPGIEAEIICPENGSQCILKIEGGTISLDHSVSDNILVSAV
jgi:Fe2+ transport system protein FeoA